MFWKITSEFVVVFILTRSMEKLAIQSRADGVLEIMTEDKNPRTTVMDYPAGIFVRPRVSIFTATASCTLFS